MNYLTSNAKPYTTIMANQNIYKELKFHRVPSGKSSKLRHRKYKENVF